MKTQRRLSGRGAHRAPLAALTAAALLVAPASGRAAPALDCYAEGNRALDAGRFADAVAAFDAATRDAGCAGSRAGLLFNKAEALRRLAEASGDPEPACEAERTYRAIIVAHAPPVRLERAARDGIRAASERCPRLVELSPDHTLAWALTGAAAAALVAGGVLYGLALDAIDAREAADARAIAAPPGTADERAALRDFGDQSDRADALGISAYALGGLGVALAIGAGVAWLVDDAAPVRVAPAAEGVGLSVGGVW